MELFEKRVSSNSLFPTTQQSQCEYSWQGEPGVGGAGQASDLQPIGGETLEWEELCNPQISSPLVGRARSGRSAVLGSPAHWMDL